MSAFVVLLLAALWVAILVPGALRGRRHSPATSVDSFERSMRILATDLRNRLPGDYYGRGSAVHPPARWTPPPAPPASPSKAARHETLRRRRLIFQWLGAAVGVAAVLAVVFGGAFVAVFAVSSAALAAYVAVLVQMRSTQERVQRTVRHLPLRGDHRGDGLPLVVGEHR